MLHVNIFLVDQSDTECDLMLDVDEVSGRTSGLRPASHSVC